MERFKLLGCLIVFFFQLSSHNVVSAAPTDLWVLGETDPSATIAPGILAIRYLQIPNGIVASRSIGDVVTLPTFESGVLTGIIHYKDVATGTIAGTIIGNGLRTFYLSYINGQYSGQIIDPDNELGYDIGGWSNSNQFISTKDINNLICFNYPQAQLTDELNTNQKLSSVSSVQTVTDVPIHNSKPGSPNVFYLDFDGEYVVHPRWNGGQPIDAQRANHYGSDPNNFDADEISAIKDIWEGVAEDFSLFDVNVTTDLAVYEAVSHDHRQQIIITHTCQWYTCPGGVATFNSFYYSSSGAPDAPAWAFRFYNHNRHYTASIISHELGHTVALAHDGRYSSDYHEGDKYWAPIMGAGVDSEALGNLFQWSKGEYPGATNTQDDLAIIATTLAYKPDDVGNSITNANRAKNIQKGIIGASNDKDVFYIDLEASQTLIMDVDPFIYVFADLDVQLTLKDSNGAAVATSNPEPTSPDLPPVLTSSITYNVVTPGRYYIEVKGVGYAGSVYDYPVYGSIGNYRLTITQPEIVVKKVPLVPVYLLLLDDD